MNDREVGGLMPPTSVWLRMAEELLADDGPNIVESTMSADVANGTATVTWTERHTMSETDYHFLVSRARERPAE